MFPSCVYSRPWDGPLPALVQHTFQTNFLYQALHSQQQQASRAFPPLRSPLLCTYVQTHLHFPVEFPPVFSMAVKKSGILERPGPPPGDISCIRLNVLLTIKFHDYSRARPLLTTYAQTRPLVGVACNGAAVWREACRGRCMPASPRGPPVLACVLRSHNRSKLWSSPHLLYLL